ncbi:hypothetical protein K438DRAFT_1754485 [Mycena galopus ATCC 62051]|nr:hypothetical protein K438DRAFT_1754485 [Mycena galopus ATCC 62051]
MDDTGLVFDGYADIHMVYPHCMINVDGPLRNKIASYLTTNYDLPRLEAHDYLPAQLSLWGKLKWLVGGDLIHAWDMVSTYHNSPDSVCDATFIKFTLEIDKNEWYPNLPVVLQRKAFFGQVRKFIALALPPEFPAQRDAGEQERIESEQERIILLAAVADANLIRQLPTGIGCFDAKSSDLGAPSQVIDVESIDCLAERIAVDKKRWAGLLRPEVAAKFKLIEDVGGDLNEG